MHLPERSGSRQEYYKLTYLRGDLTQELVRHLEMICLGECYANHYRLSVWEYINLLEQLGESNENLEFWRHLEKPDIDYILKMAKLKREHRNFTSFRDLNEGNSKSSPKRDLTDSIHFSPHDQSKERGSSGGAYGDSEFKDAGSETLFKNLTPVQPVYARKGVSRPQLKLRTKESDDHATRDQSKGRKSIARKRDHHTLETISDVLSQDEDKKEPAPHNQKQVSAPQPESLDFPRTIQASRGKNPYNLDPSSQRILQRSKDAIPMVKLNMEPDSENKAGKPGEKIPNLKNSKLNQALAFSSAEFDQLMQEQLETIKKQNELTDELNRRLIQQHSVIKSDEVRFRTQHLIFAKRVSMMIGYHAAEVFFKKELHTNLGVFLRKTDTDKIYSWLG